MGAGGSVLPESCRASGNINFGVSCRAVNVSSFRLEASLAAQGWQRTKSDFGSSDWLSDKHRVTISEQGHSLFVDASAR